MIDAVVVDATWWVLFVVLAGAVVFVFGVLHRAWMVALLGAAVFVAGLGLGGWVH
jgi:uncharacterized ion transporter superfamily protein YfcC